MFDLNKAFFMAKNYQMKIQCFADFVLHLALFFALYHLKT